MTDTSARSAAGKVDERQIYDSHEWGTPLVAISCPQCKNDHLVPLKAVPERCPFCLYAPISAADTDPAQEPPEQVIPYAVPQGKLTGVLERWMQGVRFRPDGMNPGLLARRAQRYLVPMWLVDSRVQGSWQAEMGFDYRLVSYEDRYSDRAGWASQEVQETKVRWEPRAGEINRVYDNVTTAALEDHRKVMRRLGTYTLEERVDYDPGLVELAAVRIPTRPPDDAWPDTNAALNQLSKLECTQASAADHTRGFELDVKYGETNWTLLLLPAYVTWYEEGGNIWPVVVNGQSGHVDGVRRASGRKAVITSLIIGIVAAILVVLGGILTLAGAIFPPGAVVGIILLVISVILGLVAPIPAISAWAHNRNASLANWL
ncbi:MAG: hypothetical protein MUQ10_18305 [Anaerolineae bacterium]|nr:hypothetical protein [Anaerolineae bacterium]